VTPLPIDPYIPQVVDALRRVRAAVLTAQPGAGKTTRVPPALVEDGPVILLQPRRVAARAIASRIAAERQWHVGREIGWQIRFERRFGADTRLLVATEGILTARFQQDPLLSAFTTIVLDEFHERSIHADLALAFAKQAWRARSDLRILVMSATVDADPIADFLDGCPVIDAPGRTHPIHVEYAPGQTVADAALGLSTRVQGDTLCFLPGAFEIRRAITDLGSKIGADVDVLPLYGALASDDQDRALIPSPAGRRRIVVATNIAETSLTVPGVTAVVDSGLHKVARYDAARGIDSLVTERITQDSADQRAGRAGRLSVGVVCRLWDARDRLRPHREAEIHRVDLSSAILDVMAWGAHPRDLEWFERPTGDAIDAALALLERLGAVQSGRLTPIGEKVKRFPLHPRLARVLVAANGARSAARACALLAEREFHLSAATVSRADLLSAVDRWGEAPSHVVRVANEIEQTASRVLGPGRTQVSDEEFCRAILAGYPDRVAQRRSPGSPRVKLASGTGAVIAAHSGVRDSEFVVAIEVTAATRPGDPDSIVRIASGVDREWLTPNAVEIVHRFDSEAGIVRALEVERYDALTLVERPVAVDVEIAADLLTDEWMRRKVADDDLRWLARLKFAGHSIVVRDIVRTAAYGVRALGDIRLERALTSESLRAVERDAPDMLRVPSGRSVRLEYGDDGTVTASVKLQELFGLAETPRIGPRREPVLLALLAPNGRPVQLTRDLRSFWERTYPEIRKELRGRYPKHPWPEDPWSAPPTARTKKRPSSR
jgi:ATP-dependent helicase HrpB